MAFPEEEVPLPLVRRSARPPVLRHDVDEADDDVAAFEARLGKKKRAATGERLRPASAGALTGALGGLAAFGSVALIDPSLAARAFHGVSRLAQVPVEPTAMIIVFGIALLAGALVGAVFAKLTSRLRRWFPLLTWSLVVFPSIVVALLAVQRTYLPRAHFLAPKPLLLASLAFAVVWSLVVLLRGRGEGRRIVVIED